jgi:2'-5' RNA ligase
MAPLRVFLAVDIPENIKKKLFNLAQKIDKEGVVPVSDQNLHVTLKFFGDLSFDKIVSLEAKLRDISSQPLKVTIKGVGVFPSEDYIRVIWAGCTGLEPLVNQIEETLGSQFGGKEDERFVGHITLARVKRKTNLRDFLQLHKNDSFGEFTTDTFELKSSQLTKSGPIYSTVSEFELK